MQNAFSESALALPKIKRSPPPGFFVILVASFAIAGMWIGFGIATFLNSPSHLVSRPPQMRSDGRTAVPPRPAVDHFASRTPAGARP